MASKATQKMPSTFRAVSIVDYEEEAARAMDGDAVGYFNSGSDGEETLAENRSSGKR